MITWTCHTCQQPITGQGVLWCDMQAVRASEHTVRGIVPWLPVHLDCWGTDEPYAIDLDQLRTWADVAGWTEHLSGKSWLPFTDWFALMHRRAKEAA